MLQEKERDRELELEKLELERRKIEFWEKKMQLELEKLELEQETYRSIEEAGKANQTEVHMLFSEDQGLLTTFISLLEKII